MLFLTVNTSPKRLVFLLYTTTIVYHVVWIHLIVLQHSNVFGSTTDEATLQQRKALSTVTCYDNEWKTHPTLCGIILQQQQQQQQPLTSPFKTTTKATTTITSDDLYYFAKAMGWIVDLRRANEEDNYNSTITETLKTATTTIASTVMRQLRHSQSDATVSVSSKEDSVNEASSSNGMADDSSTSTSSTSLPVVLVHGMGDSCFNDGMIHITQYVSSLLNNTYTVCIPIGSSQSEDTNNGYFLNMNDSIDYFAQQIQRNQHLMQAKTFHAVGFSQGNNIIRGYIARYNDNIIPVHTFISINGVNAGVGAVPHCIPDQLVASSSSLSYDVAFSLCDLLMEQASAAAYTNFAQQHSFQANYWRDPRPSEYGTYCTYSQLARLNNEVLDHDTQFNETYRTNWAQTSKFVWIMANDDRTVYPPQGEQWGTPDPMNPYQHVLLMNETPWYIHDYFGLRTAQEQDKNYFESFPGDHLQFTKDDFMRWIHTYL